MPNGVIALDASVRTYDKAGRLHISRTRISKATVNPYYGYEIPDHELLRLDPNKIYQLLRDPEELARAAPTFERNQILAKHIQVSADKPQNDVIAGAIGSDIEFVDPYLWADVCIWDAIAIAGIETETVREFSCAYHYKADMTPGVYQGMPFDGVMREIFGNHLTLVESGRAGSDVLAADEAIKTMKTTKLGKALFVTLGGMSPKLAQDSALLALVGRAAKKTLNKGEISAKLIAMDADLDPTKLATALDAILALDAEPEKKTKVAEDEDEDDDSDAKIGEDEEEDEDEKKKKKVAEDAEEEKKSDKKVAEDAEEEKKSDKKVEAAMDSFKKELRDADEARRAVRPIVGDVIAQDSAAEIYGFALDHLKVDRKDVTGVPALKALFSLASSRSASPAPRIAQDSAGLASKFPNANRFCQQ